MQFYFLKYFYDSCRLGGMTEAARENRVSRPAISQAIKALEASLGAPLVHHKKRHFEITPAGQRVHDHAIQLFDQVEELKRIAIQEHSEQQLRGRIQIGISQVLTTYRVDDALSKIRELHPELDVQLKIQSASKLLDFLEQRELDVVIALSDESRKGVLSETLEEGSFVLLRPKNVPFKSAMYSISERRIETETVQRMFQKKFKKEMPLFAEVPSWDSIWNWLHKGLSGGLLPDLYLRRKGAKRTDYTIDLKDVHPYRIAMYYREKQKKNPLVRLAVESIQSEFRKDIS